MKRDQKQKRRDQKIRDDLDKLWSDVPRTSEGTKDALATLRASLPYLWQEGSVSKEQVLELVAKFNEAARVQAPEYVITLEEVFGVK